MHFIEHNRQYQIVMTSEKLNCNQFSDEVSAASSDVGDAVGMGKAVWYVAIVKNNTEKSVQERLVKLGHKAYVATQRVIRVWKNGRRSSIDKVVIPSLVFVKCTESSRKQIVNLPFISRFMMNRSSGNKGTIPNLAIIQEGEIELLRYMLGQSDVPVSFVDRQLMHGDKVKIIRGSMKGIEGEVTQVSDGKAEIIVGLGIIGTAKMTIDSAEIELLK